MAFHESFAEKFSELLKEIPTECGLLEWQHLYRQASYLMGIKILENFPREVVGPITPPDTGNPGANNGGHPGDLCQLICFILALRPYRDPPLRDAIP